MRDVDGGSSRPGVRIRDRLGAARIPRPGRRAGRIAWEVVLFTAAYFTYFGVRGLTAGDEAAATVNASRIVNLERELGILWEPRWQDVVIDYDAAVALINWVYIWGHWPVIIGAMLWLLVFRRSRYLLLRNAMFISGGIGFLFFAFFPVSPPRFGLIPVVDTVTVDSLSYRTLQPPALTNQYAAFPSLHFGWNLIVGLVMASQVRRWLVGFLWLVLPAAMAAAVVLTANHYILDVVGGGLLALLGLAVATPWARRAANLRADPDSRPLTPRPGAPYLVAHRAGNGLVELAHAERARAALVEADVHLFRGRLELRHEKTFGPLARYWERWYIVRRADPPPSLDAVLGLAHPDTPLLLDLKGFTRRLSRRVAIVLAGHERAGPVSVCARNWWLLAPFRADPRIRIVATARGRLGRWALLRGLGPHGLSGVTLHRDLIRPDVVARLHRSVPTVLCWPVNTSVAAAACGAAGVDGVITDDADALIDSSVPVGSR